MFFFSVSFDLINTEKTEENEIILLFKMLLIIRMRTSTASHHFAEIYENNKILFKLNEMWKEKKKETKRNVYTDLMRLYF